jgi:outer membrane protein OmpA-like peptidoglycan-associated protein
MRRRLWLAAALAALPAGALFAASKPGRGAALFLRVPMGARAAAMGEAFTAVADDGQALFWNPAGLAPQRDPALQLDHASYFDSTRLDGLAFSYPTLWGGWGAGTRWFTGPSLDRVRGGVELGGFQVSERTAELAMAVGKRNFSAGALARYYESRLDGESLDSVMADVGVLKAWKRDRYRIGAVMQNIGSSFGYGSSADLRSPPPRVWKAGFARRSQNWTLALETVKPEHLQTRLHAGLELWLAPPLAMRFGYVLPPARERSLQEALSRWRFGLGARLGGAQADYAYAPEHLLGDVHRFSLSFRFPSLRVLEEAGRLTFEPDPAAFSPNQDGRKDATFLMLGIQGFENVSKWLMEVRAPQGNPVWSRRGRGAPPGLTEWAGTGDDGKTLTEGEYLLQARVWSPDHQALSPVRRVTLDLSPPQVELLISTAAFSPDGDGVDDEVGFVLRARDRAGAPQWLLSLFAQDSPTVSVFSATGTFQNGVSTLTWNGTARGGQTAANGLYNALLVTEDAAGNQTTLTSAPLELFVSSETILRNLPDLKTEKTVDGYRIVLPSARLFEKPASARIAEESKDLLSQLLALAKAFPDHEIFINGYAGSERTAAKRIELSSAQAWALYSALVKAGVAATRLEVHGQGGERKDPNRLEIFLSKPAP